MSNYICLVNEEIDGDSNTIKEIVRNYNILGPDSAMAARFALLTDLVKCPAEHPESLGMYRSDVEVEESEDSRYDYTAKVSYKYPSLSNLPVVDAERLLPGSSGSQSVRVKSALNVVSFTAADGETAINNYGLIGATKDGVEGIDEELPAFNFGIERIYAKGTITITLMAQFYQFHKRVNSQPWRGFQIGEVLFKDYEFDNESDDHDKIRYYVECSPNQTNVVFPSPFGNITVPTIRGWDYVDISTVDDPGGGPYKVPHTVTVMETKHYADLNVII